MRYRSDAASRRRRLWGAGDAGYGAAFWKSETESEPWATFREAIGVISENYVNPSIPKEKTFGEEVFTKWVHTLERFRAGKELNLTAIFEPQ